MSQRPALKVAQFGLGPIGLETLKAATEKPTLVVLGGVDIDPAKTGRDLGDLTGLPALAGRRVFASLEALLATARPDVVFHTAVSRTREAFPSLAAMARAGLNVVSSCEELLLPHLREPQLAAELDQLCRQNGARIVGAGVNPGFVMDLLPVCLTGVCRQVRAIHVQRVVNASTRRGPLQRKIGSGWTPAEFEHRFQAGTAGHAGLRESAAFIARALGWELTELVETGRAIVAEHDIRTPFVEVQRGQCCGLHQHAEAKCNGRVCVSLDLKMYLDAPDPHDACQIDGDPPLQLRIPGGVAGDTATVAALLNVAPCLLQSPPGLRLLTELPLPHCWA